MGEKDEVILVQPEYDARGDRSRVTARLDMYFQIKGEDPIHMSTTLRQFVDGSNQEPYHRKRQIVGEEWTDFDLGWLDGDDIGYILIQNKTGSNRSLVPTEEEKKKAASRVVVLRDKSMAMAYGFKIRPGGFFVAEPEEAKHLMLCCENGEAEITFTVYPR